MKKILLFILLLLPALVMAQQTRPTTPVQKPQNTPYLDTSTGIRWYFDGVNYFAIPPFTPPNTMLTGLGMSVVSSTLTVATGTWRIGNVVYNLSPAKNFTLKPRDSVYYRYEAVYATGVNNGIGIKVDSVTPFPIQHQFGADTIAVGYVLITPTGTSIIPPSPTNQFVFSNPLVQQFGAYPWVTTLKADTIKVSGQYIFPSRHGRSGEVIQDDGNGNLFFSSQAIYLPGFGLQLTGQTFSGDSLVFVTHKALLDTLLRHAAHFNPTQFTISNDTISLIGGGGGGGSTIYTANGVLPNRYIQLNYNSEFLLGDTINYYGLYTHLRSDSTYRSAVFAGNPSGSQQAGFTADGLGYSNMTAIKDAVQKTITIDAQSGGNMLISNTLNEGLLNNEDHTVWELANDLALISTGAAKQLIADSLAGHSFTSVNMSNSNLTSTGSYSVTLGAFNWAVGASSGGNTGNLIVQNTIAELTGSSAIGSSQVSAGGSIASMYALQSGGHTQNLSLTGGATRGTYTNSDNLPLKYAGDYSTNERLSQRNIASVKTTIAIADSVKGTISGGVTSVTGTTNRITSTGGTTPVIDISATFEALLGKVGNPLSQFASTTSAQLAGVLSDETGIDKVVYSTSPTLVTPNLGTPSTLVLTNATGLPNAGLSNSTISGIALGSNLANLTAGRGIILPNYNGGTTQAVILDTTQNYNWLKAQTITKNSLGTTQALGLMVQNTIAAANNAQQVSPFTEWAGNSWGTTGSASTLSAFRAYTLPVQNGLGFYGEWHLQSTFGGSGAWVDALKITGDGILTVTSNVIAGEFNGALRTASSNTSLTLQNGRTFNAAGSNVLINPGTVTNSSGQYNIVSITQTYNTTSTAAASDLSINRTETAVGSGTQRYLSLQTASTENFGISNKGEVMMREGSNGFAGQTTLVTGTKAITITGVTTSSRCFIQAVSQGGTVSTTFEYAAVCTANTLTITALTTGNVTNTLDTSVLNYMIIN